MGLFSRMFGRAENAVDSRLSQFYNGRLSEWQDIYNGGGHWRYTRKGGIKGGSRRVASLNAAKTVCEELSRLCCAEGCELVCSDEEGSELISKVLRENRFEERFPQFLERVFALGGGAIRIYWDNGIKLDFVTADCFVPTDWESGRITGAAFASRITRGGESYILSQSQRVTDSGLEVENRLTKENGAKAELSKLMPELPESYRIEGLTEPLFVYFKAGSGVLECCTALGASVFDGAEDALKSIDTVFDSLEREFILGKKRIIVPYYAVRGEYDSNGKLTHYFDVNDEVFQAMSTSDTEELSIVDSSAELRVTEHLDALTGLLDLLCAQVGLSEGALSYKDGTLRTATEVVSRNSRTYRTQKFYRRRISEGLERMAECIFTLAKMAGLLGEGEYSVSVTYADGAAEDDDTRIERAIKLYNAGLISRERALSSIYGISIDEAKMIGRSEQDERE